RAAAQAAPGGRGKTEEGRAPCARQVRRGRGHLHRRPLVHSPLRLPDAHDQGQPGPAAHRSGGDRDRRLRRLRPMRRECARRGALPVVLPRRSDPEPDLVGQAVERQFTKEIESLRLGSGATFHGEGILAVTKALLQSGVSYVGGYQGAPVSHLLDVMVQARDYMDELGVHVEACTSEASAAAMLGASIGYPVRGAVTWKSIVGTNVASDALSYLASAGVIGGALIVLGEDYGEGGVVAQERSHAFALKSMMWLLDPRPNLTTITDMVERGFELSQASNSPVMMELPVCAAHTQGSFTAKANRAPTVSTRNLMEKPADFLYERLAHPPAIFPQEKK